MIYQFFNLFLFIQYKSKTFLDFINDDSVKDNNEKIINNSLDNNIENIAYIQKQNKDYKNKINELENKIIKLELIIKEKDNIINEYKQNKEIKNITNNNNNYINKIKELEKEIEKYKNYCLLPGEKLITIKFISIDQSINFEKKKKKTDNIRKLEKSLYEKYPKYKDTDNYLLVNGKKLNRNRTLEENKIKDNDILTLGVFDE